MLHPALLIGGRNADVQLVIGRKDHDTAAAVVRETLTDGQQPGAFHAEILKSFDGDVLGNGTVSAAAAAADAAAVGLAQREDVDAARVRYDHGVVAAAVHVDDALGAQRREVRRRRRRRIVVAAEHVHFAVLRQSRSA